MNPPVQSAVSDTSARRRPRGQAFRAGTAILITVLVLWLGYLAHLQGRPVTAALLAVFSVTAVGALLGLRAGVLAGVAASITYNLLFTDPYLRFSFASADDLVPIIALNLSAIASGLIAGRLRDRAVAAETSSRRIADLLQFSQDVQRAISLDQVEGVVSEFVSGGADVKVTLKASPPCRPLEQLKEVVEPSGHAEPHCTRFLLESGEGPVGELSIEHDHQPFYEDSVRTLLPIVAMATQRCALAEEAAEAALIRQSEKFKTALLSSVSHDLRTPLAAISAAASSLASLDAQLDPDTRRDLLQTIQEQCGRLDRLTGNLLNLGRIDGGLDVARMPVVDAVEVLGSALARVRAAYPAHSFQRSFVSPDAAVQADEALLEQLFVNVLENAAIHTRPGTAVRVNATRMSKSLTVSIEDDGPGIAPEELGRVFDRFYQGSARGSRRMGSGLGLSIAKGFAEAVGGTIHAGRPILAAHGTRIDISLPLVNAYE